MAKTGERPVGVAFIGTGAVTAYHHLPGLRLDPRADAGRRSATRTPTCSGVARKSGASGSPRPTPRRSAGGTTSTPS